MDYFTYLKTLANGPLTPLLYAIIYLKIKLFLKYFKKYYTFDKKYVIL